MFVYSSLPTPRWHTSLVGWILQIGCVCIGQTREQPTQAKRDLSIIVTHLPARSSCQEDSWVHIIIWPSGARTVVRTTTTWTCVRRSGPLFLPLSTVIACAAAVVVAAFVCTIIMLLLLILYCRRSCACCLLTLWASRSTSRSSLWSRFAACERCQSLLYHLLRPGYLWWYYRSYRSYAYAWLFSEWRPHIMKHGRVNTGRYGSYSCCVEFTFGRERTVLRINSIITTAVPCQNGNDSSSSQSLFYCYDTSSTYAMLLLCYNLTCMCSILLQ